MKLFISILSICAWFSSVAQEKIHIVPMPLEVRAGKGSFEITPATSIVLEGSGLENSASFLKQYLLKNYGYTLKTGKTTDVKNAIVLNFERMDYPIQGAYSLEVNDKGVYIAGDNEAGVFYGIQTLIQLLPASKEQRLKIPQLFVNDHPRFSYRGLEMDVSRHFFSTAYVKKYIDFLALHKLNKFHWHLSDDQGWRIEIKKYPRLTEVGSCRNQTLVGRFGSDKYDSTRYCGFYTQDEIRDIVKYASARYIDIIPEIDMPGHSLATLTAYPFLGCSKGPYKVMETWGVAAEVLCAGNDSTYIFMQDVLDEVMQLFPSKYIHIGGDECPKEAWKTCPVCQQRIKEQHLKNEHELQSYFTQRIEKYVNGKGRKIIGWDEILEGGLAPNAAVMSWRGEAGGVAAAKQGHNVVMTPETPLYLNFSQTKNEDSITQGGYNPLEAVYNYEPLPKELTEVQSRFIMGAQGNLWSEYIPNEKKLEYMLFPRIAALSELLWSEKARRSWPGFEQRLPEIMHWYKFMGINYSNAYFDIQPTVVVNTDHTINWKLETNSKDSKIIYVKDSSSDKRVEYKDPIVIDKGGRYGAALTDKNLLPLGNWIWQDFSLNKATGKMISLSTAPNKSYSLGGASALVDGIQNDKGMLRSSQFLGFNGKDLEAVIDLGKPTEITEMVLHAFEQKGSWIYRPSQVQFYKSDDGINFKPIDSNVQVTGTKNLLYSSKLTSIARYVKVVAKNNGIIRAGEPGAGNTAWLFADEIEIK